MLEIDLCQRRGKNETKKKKLDLSFVLFPSSFRCYKCSLLPSAPLQSPTLFLLLFLYFFFFQN